MPIGFDCCSILAVRTGLFPATIRQVGCDGGQNFGDGVFDALVGAPAEKVAHRLPGQVVGVFERENGTEPLSQLRLDIFGMHCRKAPRLMSDKADSLTTKRHQAGLSDFACFGNRLREELGGRDFAWLSRETGISTSTLSDYGRGKLPRVDKAMQIAKALGVSVESLMAPGGDTLPVGDRQLSYRGPEADGDDLVEVVVSDVAYGMGGAHIDDAAVATSIERFPRAFIRQFTRSPATQLYFATGIGDSMEPTIHSSDLVLIDRAQSMLRLSDQIWALHAGQIGMIKRVRVLPDGTVVLVSDNPAVSDYVAGEGELQLIGRVVAVVKKV